MDLVPLLPTFKDLKKIENKGWVGGINGPQSKNYTGIKGGKYLSEVI